ncbi:HNH endonuclease signature motif containing protein [Actinomycetospora sp.]|jgi:hypothetical protein|uniref:HNH endonuclease signature motif containing protein n=1 Tax=Actinomycetospora sp. TaxID=1872135 RepID=UPI002F40E775
MSGSVVDEAVMRQAREVMAAARRAEHAVLCQVAMLESVGAAEAAGYGSSEGLLQDLWRVDRGEARRLVRHSRLLCPQTTLGGGAVVPSLGVTAPVAAAGGLDRGHVRVIDEAVRYLERVEGMDPAAVVEAEEFLVEHAASLTPHGLAQAAARLIAALDQDGVAPEDEAEPTDELRIGRRRDGSLVLKGRFRGRADIELLVAAFDALSGRAGPHDERELEARYAAALLELAGLAMAPGGIGASVDPSDRAAGETTAPAERGAGDPRNLLHPDSNPGEPDPDSDTPAGDDEAGSDGPAGDDPAGDHSASSGEAGAASEASSRLRAPGRALLTLTMPYTWLRNEIGHGLVGAEEAISPTEARRLACDAGIVPMVLGSRSEPLDLGRMSYAVTEAIRRALVERDRGCAAPDCRRRAERCHAHHVHHWIDGGETRLDNLCLLCAHHHRLIHRGDWQVTMINGRPWFTPPAWIDPEQRLLRGGPQI